ncbi:MAG TPA: tetraacyldisaccharide 4'-kinase, partial [Bryobacteraceae bacterium]|nr:tetraacyldisaccharide 4'-kinase [Bryobacteraceae bacterium]
AMGGSGKTPVVRQLVAELKAAGYQPAVLTRGYGRRSNSPVTLLRAGSSADVETTGDEAQTVLQDGIAHVAIGADRFRAALAAEQEFSPDVFVMDDGFQHARLGRDIDVVVLDGLDPLAGGHVFPAGSQREPFSSLRRCHAIVISRTEGRAVEALRKHLPEGIPMFVSETRPACWRSLETGARASLDDFRGAEVFAFCGLGNPDAFRRTLSDCGCRVRGFTAFPDHHWFTEADLAAIREQANGYALVTTEKDAARVPHPFPAHALEIRCLAPGLAPYVTVRLRHRLSVTRL